MEMPGRKSDYTLLSQIPDDEAGASAATSFYELSSAEGKFNKVKTERGFDWDGNGDQKINTQANRIGNLYSSMSSQRQSSGSSFDESSHSGDYYGPTLSIAEANEMNGLGIGNFLGDDFRVQAVGSGGSSGKSWAQQTEESYQLQLALALRLSSEATCADDPNFMDPMPDEAALSSSSSSAQTVSHRFWVVD